MVAACPAEGSATRRRHPDVTTLAWSQVATILIVILATVVISEALSARVRRTLT